MASATGIPDRRVTDEEVVHETEPLLGRPGGATQEEGVSIFRNLILGEYANTAFKLLFKHRA